MLLGLIFTVGAFLFGMGIGNLVPNSNGWTFAIFGALLIIGGVWLLDKGPSRIKRRVRSSSDDDAEPVRTKAKKRPRVRVQ